MMKTTKINAIVRAWQNIFVATMFSLAISFNMQAQETVIAVWDFANNSVAGEIHPDFASAANPDLTYLQGGGSGDNAFTNEDETGGDLDMSFTMSTTSANAAGWSNYVLNNLFLGPTSGTPNAGSGLVDNKFHFSVSFKEITIAQGSGDKVTFVLKDANQGSGTNWRQTGLQIAENANNGTTLKASTMIINGGNQNGTLKLAGHFGETQGFTLTDLTIGVTVDYSAGSIRFWIDSPDTYASGDGSAWGFKMYNDDGWANTNGFPALTATPAAGAGLANSVVQMMQFNPVFQDPGSKMVLDQIKISTGTYENTVEAGNTVSAPEGCSYTLQLRDTYGDTWNGNSIDLLVNGEVVGNYTETSNTSDWIDTATVDVLYGDVVSVDYLGGGNYPGENQWQIVDADGTVVSSGNYYDGNGDPVTCTDPNAIAFDVSASTDYANATFSFDLANFTVGAAGDTGVDGHIHYSLNGGSEVMIYSSDDLTLSDLPNGDHTIVFSLVDNAHQPLDPPVTATVEFSTNNGLYDGDFPFCSSFDLDLGNWTTNISSGSSDWASAASNPTTGSSSVDAYSGGGSALYYSYNYNGDSSTLISPIMDLSAMINPQVTFFMANPDWGGDQETLAVWYRASVNDAWTSLGEYSDPSLSFSEITLELPDASSTYQVAFNATSGYGYGVLLDDICVADAGPAQANVTFTVNTANIEVGPNGIYLGGGVFGGANAVALSDDDADGTWEVTVEMEAGTTGNYAFFNSPDAGDAWGTKENLDGQECADPNAYNDRTLPPIDGDMTIQHCFGSCESDGTCPAPAPTYDVTFSVDMSNYVLGLGDGDVVYLNGNFAGWCGDCLPMSDDDGDGIWTITIPLEDGDYEYKFTVNGWNNQESWPGDGELSCPENADNGQFENRAFSVAGEDMTLATVYWNLCVGEVPGVFHTVTFEVNTSAIVGGVGPNGIYAGGGILGNAQGLQLTDDDGDGVYVGSIDLEEGTTGNYIFLNSPSDGGDWGAKENLEGQDCADPANYNDRILEPVTGDITLLACFGFCSGNGTGECPSDIVTYNVTFSVNTANITVGENGMYAGGGVLGGANAVALSDDDNDGVWEATIPMEEGTSGNYAYFNSPSSSDDWGTKENIEGQDCADPANYNDRILAPITEDTVLLACFGQCSGDGTGICPAGDPAMMLQGIMDFTITDPDADPDTDGNQSTYGVNGAQGKAIHLYVNEDIEDLSLYGLGVANNGGGTDGEEWFFPAGTALAGQHILVARSLEAMEVYLSASSIFDQVILAEGSSISQNGDDAIELYFLGGVIETFGDPDTDGSGEAWEYMDSWAYKVNGDWTYGGVNCSDPESGQSTTTSCESGCPYPFADCTGDDLAAYLSAEGGWRYQYEVAGYRGVGPATQMFAEWWNAGVYEDFDNGTYPNPSGENNGLVDDLMFFTVDGGFTFDTGEDGSIMGKKPEVDAAFDPTGENAYPADNEYNEYWNYPLDDFTDTYTLGNDGTYDIIEFSTVGALGFYTSTGAQAYQILEQNNTTMYVRNVGSEGNAWYSMLTTDAHNLSTSENEILDMMIYPNPVDGNYVTILSPVQGLKEIEVYSVTGRKVIDTAINGSTLDVSSLNTGFYLLKVTINGQNKVSKLVVR